MLLEINFTMILFAVSFLVFIYLLNLTLYKPLGKVIEERKNLISGDYETSKELAKKANELLDNYKEQIKLARSKAQNTIQDSISTAQKEKERKILELMTSLNREKEFAIEQIRIEQEEAMKQLQTKLKTLIDLITTKVIGSMEEKTLVSSH